MKKATFILASLVILAFSSCEEKEKEIVSPTVVEETNTPAAAEEEESNGTSISVNGEGVEFSSKDGEKKTEVEVKDGSGNITIQK